MDLWGGVNWAFGQTFTVSDAPSNGQWAENTHWYFIKNKKGSAYAYLSTASNATDESGNLKIVTGLNADENCYWCVVSDGDGYKFYNKAEGTGKVLGMTTVTSNTGADARAKMYDDGTAEDNVVKTFYYSATQTKPNGVTANAFRLQSSGNNYWNERGGYLALWTNADAVGSSCEGSAYIFVEPTSIYEDLLTQVQTAVSTYPSYVGKPLSHTQEQINTLKASIRSTNPTELSDFYTYAEELEAALATFKDSPIQSLEAGKLYRMVSAFEGFESNQHVRKNILAAT